MLPNSLFQLCLFSGLAAADLLGPRFPAPVDITSEDSLVAAAWKRVTGSFDKHLKQNETVKLLRGIENITFSVGVYSLHDDAAAADLQYHYTSPEIQAATAGTNKVDADSVYRVASVSKLVTTYTGMVLLTEEQWNRPLTQIFPEWLEPLEDGESSTELTQWEHVTPLSLAAQLSGVAGNAPPWVLVDRYRAYVDALASDAPAENPVEWGLPPVASEYPYFQPFCLAANSTCTGDKFIQAVEDSHPTYKPWTSPTYSNNGFMILGQVIARLTGKTFDAAYRDALFDPLGMTSSNSSNPFHLKDRAVIPLGGDPRIFFVDVGLSAASGGITTTLNDINKMSVSILNNTLLTPEQTRKWMKPMSHTADLKFSVGAGWEIYRFVHPENTTSAGSITDIYTKLGDSGPTGGISVMIPEYGAGFNGLVAGGALDKSGNQRQVFDAILKELVPGLEAQAAAEAQANFGGTYVPSEENKSLNTSITLAVNGSIAGGILVTEFISNGTNILDPMIQSSIFSTSGGLRLLPTILDATTMKYAFRMRGSVTPEVIEAAASVGPFTAEYVTNADWVMTGQLTYAANPIEAAVFEISEGGEALSVTLPAFNVTLIKK